MQRGENGFTSKPKKLRPLSREKGNRAANIPFFIHILFIWYIAFGIELTIRWAAIGEFCERLRLNESSSLFSTTFSTVPTTGPDDRPICLRSNKCAFQTVRRERVASGNNGALFSVNPPLGLKVWSNIFLFREDHNERWRLRRILTCMNFYFKRESEPHAQGAWRINASRG